MTIVTDLLTRFGEDFNEGRHDRMAHYYAHDFAAVVNGAFVDRHAYLEAISQLLTDGYRGIRFEVNRCRPLGAGTLLADGTTCIDDPSGTALQSIFSILCGWNDSGTQFLHTHTSMSSPQ
jgi:hypothetical protein